MADSSAATNKAPDRPASIVFNCSAANASRPTASTQGTPDHWHPAADADAKTRDEHTRLRNQFFSTFEVDNKPGPNSTERQLFSTELLDFAWEKPLDTILRPFPLNDLDLPSSHIAQKFKFTGNDSQERFLPDTVTIIPLGDIAPLFGAEHNVEAMLVREDYWACARDVVGFYETGSGSFKTAGCTLAEDALFLSAPCVGSFSGGADGAGEGLGSRQERLRRDGELLSDALGLGAAAPAALAQPGSSGDSTGTSLRG